MRPKVREVLDKIDEVLSGEDYLSSRDLWDILTALRGPDDAVRGFEAKAVSTAPIRTIAFPKAAAEYFKGEFVHAVFAPAARFPRELTDAEAEVVGGHFSAHIDAALRAISGEVYDSRY